MTSLERTITVSAAILFSSVLAGDVIAQSSPDQAEATPTDKPEVMPKEPHSVSFELKDNLIRIPIVVNGKRQSGVLDSGAGALLVDRSVSQTLALREGVMAGDAAGAGSEAKQLLPVTFATVIAGPLRFKDIDGYSIDLAHLSTSARFPVDVLLGAPAFKYGAVSIDYPRRRITFGPSGSAPKCEAPIPLEIVNDVPIVELELQTSKDARPVRLKVMVDLGTRHAALVVGGPFVRSDAGKPMLAIGKPQQIGHGIGGQVQGTAARAGMVRLGPVTFSDVEVKLTPNVPAFEMGLIDGTVGVPLWLQSIITFDYPARQLCIASSKEPAGTGAASIP